MSDEGINEEVDEMEAINTMIKEAQKEGLLTEVVWT